MRNELLDSLEEREPFDWENSELRAMLVSLWTVVKWIAAGFFAIVAWLIYLVMSIVFSEVTEKR